MYLIYYKNADEDYLFFALEGVMRCKSIIYKFFNFCLKVAL